MVTVGASLECFVWVLHMGQLSSWSRDNRVQVVGLTILGQIKGLWKGAGKQPVQSEPVHSWASIWWEGGESEEAEGLVFKELQPVSNTLLFSCGQISGIIYTHKKKSKKACAAFSEIDFWKSFCKPAEIPIVSSLKPTSIPRKTFWTWGFVGMLENFPVKHPFEHLVEKQNIQSQKEKTEGVV